MQDVKTAIRQDNATSFSPYLLNALKDHIAPNYSFECFGISHD